MIKTWATPACWRQIRPGSAVELKAAIFLSCLNFTRRQSSEGSSGLMWRLGWCHSGKGCDRCDLTSSLSPTLNGEWELVCVWVLGSDPLVMRIWHVHDYTCACVTLAVLVPMWGSIYIWQWQIKPRALSAVVPSRCPHHGDSAGRIMGWLIEGAVMADIERAPNFPTSSSEHHCVFRLTELHHLPGTQQALITHCNVSAAFGVAHEVFDVESSEVCLCFFVCVSMLCESCFMFIWSK